MARSRRTPEAAGGVQLRGVTLRGPTLAGDAARGEAYPFSVPAVRSLGALAFRAPVTFFVGENGSGKSTLLEGLAAAAGLPAVGSVSVQRDATLANARELGAALQLTWTARTRRGFFLRAEDFFGFTKALAVERATLERELAELPEKYADRSTKALQLATMPIASSLAGMERRYGKDLDANSHGQSFLALFRSRFVPKGLYLLDEPEAPLSPHSQMALLAMIHEMVAQGAQFVIATHSPIVLAYPGATIFTFDTSPVSEIAYDDTDHVAVTRAFLTDRERYLRQLLDDRGTFSA